MELSTGEDRHWIVTNVVLGTAGPKDKGGKERQGKARESTEAWQKLSETKKVENDISASC